MSTLPERLEKRCLNCNALIHGRYCQICGQENVHHKMTFWGMVKHFVFDLLHFDGKFFLTITTLFKKPGLVPLEYINGKRVKYLEPFRMYIFTSTFFFILYFTFFQSKHSPIKIESTEQRSNSFVLNGYRVDPFENYDDFFKNYKIKNPKENISFINQMVLKKYFSFPQEDRVDANAFAKRIVNDFLHRIPQLIFCILPFFIALLTLINIRNKHFVYSDHGIFSLYMASFSFWYIFLCQLVSKGFNALHLELIDRRFGLIAFFIYNILFYFALKRFYGQSTMKTLYKFFVLIFLNFIVAILIATIFLVITTFLL